MRPHGILFELFHDGLPGDADTVHPAGEGSLSGDEFDCLLEQMNHRRILPAHAFLDRALSGRLRPGDRCLTFDDTLRCQYDVAVPVLEAHNLTAFWFVNTSVMEGNIERMEIYRRFRLVNFACPDDFYAAFAVVLHESEFGQRAEQGMCAFDPARYLIHLPLSHSDRRYRFMRDEVLGPQRYATVMDRMIRLSDFDIRSVAKTLWMDDLAVGSLHDAGHIIGMHSHTHPMRLAQLHEDEQVYEYRANHSHLTALLGEPPVVVSHPCDSYDDRTLRILHELGVKCGFRGDSADGYTTAMELPRQQPAPMVRRAAA